LTLCVKGLIRAVNLRRTSCSISYALIEILSKKNFSYIYGPVPSWRLGISLGIDLLSSKRKICNFNCIYCQLGNNSKFTTKPKVFVKASDIIAELKRLPPLKIDYLTFSGRGEPCLAKNLGRAIKAVKRLNIAPVAVLTNAALINQANIRKSLSLADFVIAKLDAYSSQSLKRVNQPARSVRLADIIKGIKQFRKNFKGKFALQIMFVRQNQKDADKIARLAYEVNPDEVQINTPRRACRVRPLSKSAISRIKKCFSGLNLISVYDIQPKKAIPFSCQGTLTRRGKTI
jgi:wyosine [tRNA(Phe)-imidazoG37] synthetase (radical SAM superfamily)